jgi:hypothetical protein
VPLLLFQGAGHAQDFEHPACLAGAASEGSGIKSKPSERPSNVPAHCFSWAADAVPEVLNSCTPAGDDAATAAVRLRPVEVWGHPEKIDNVRAFVGNSMITLHFAFACCFRISPATRFRGA